MRAFCILIIIVAGILLLTYFYFSDYVITSGENYGFAIGMSKHEVAQQIISKYASTGMEIILTPSASKNNSVDVVYTIPSKLEGINVSEKNFWHLEFFGSEKNVLRLEFSEGELVKMVRYRRAFIP